MPGVLELSHDYVTSTSIHGISHAARSRTNCSRCFWVAVFFVCFILLIIQCVVLGLQYFAYEKRTNIELRFDKHPFPAVTVCSLNPYKNSAAMQVGSIKDLMTALEAAQLAAAEDAAAATETQAAKRRKRQAPIVRQTICICDAELSCLTQGSSAPGPGETSENCACALLNNVDWDCQFCASVIDCEYVVEVPTTTSTSTTTTPTTTSSTTTTTSTPTTTTSTSTTTTTPTTTTTTTSTSTTSTTTPTTTTSTTTTTPTTTSTTTTPSTTSTTSTTTPTTTTSTSTSTTTPTTTSTTTTTPTTTTSTSTTTTTLPPADPFDDRYGFEPGSDAITLAAKAQENIPFITATLDFATKQTLAFSKADVIKNCAFNAKTCNMETDFTELVDAKYGVCFTFNFESPARFFSSRAGPLYGLRMLLFSNTSEYMRTTDTAGTRVIVHDQDQFPFPDAFGFNAPTGTATSFGVRSFGNSRLTAPYGGCLVNTSGYDYYYPGKFSIEGCFRSCYQKTVLGKCACGDPRFPMPPNSTFVVCDQDNTEGKKCVSEFNPETELDCDCPVPCNETAYQTTISTSKWPWSLDSVPGCSGNSEDDPESSAKCTETVTSGAMVEIYFEQLNYQFMWESPAYTIYNLVSDWAGIVGFMLGLSVASLVEVVVFCAQLCEHAGQRLSRCATVPEAARLPRVVTPEPIIGDPLSIRTIPSTPTVTSSQSTSFGTPKPKRPAWK